MSTITQQSARAEGLLYLVDVALASLVRRLPPHVSVEDLRGAAQVALIEGLVQYEIAGDGDAIRTKLVARMRGAALDELRRQDPLTRKARARVRLLAETEKALTCSLEREPTDVELAQAAEMSLAQVRQVRELAAAAGYVGDADSEIFGRREVSPVSLSEPVLSPADQLARDELRGVVEAAIARMPARLATIVRGYYIEDRSIVDLAVELGITKQRVAQLRDVAVAILREDPHLREL